MGAGGSAVARIRCRRGLALKFQVIPAIDLRGGRCVRLIHGDYDRETLYSDDPVAIAREWQAQGAPLLHVVDLDGARAGMPANSTIMAGICEALTIPVEVSGGMRTIEHIRAAFAYGAGRVQLGSVAISDPELVKQAAEELPGQIVVSIDARDGEVRTNGWLEGSGVRALDLAKAMAAAGIPRIMFTDIGRDGALTEPNFDALAELVHELEIPVIASGGVSRIEHLVRLKEIGCEGAIVGKALYEQAFALHDAITAVG